MPKVNKNILRRNIAVFEDKVAKCKQKYSKLVKVGKGKQEQFIIFK